MHITIFNDESDFTAMICSFFSFFLKSKFSYVFRNLNEINEWANDCGFFYGFFSYSMHMKSKYFHLFRHESWMTASICLHETMMSMMQMTYRWWFACRTVHFAGSIIGLGHLYSCHWIVLLFFHNNLLYLVFGFEIGVLCLCLFSSYFVF